MDNGQNLLSEFLIHLPETGAWQELKQKRASNRSSPGFLSPSNRNGSTERQDSLAAAMTPKVSKPELGRNDSSRLTEINGSKTTQLNSNDRYNPYKQKANGKKRLLKRSHHTICTVYSHTEKLKQGYKIDFYISYVFGGIIQEPDGRLVPTNDLLEVQSKQVVLDRT